jgi:hypothetical protein
MSGHVDETESNLRRRDGRDFDRFRRADEGIDRTVRVKLGSWLKEYWVLAMQMGSCE